MTQLTQQQQNNWALFEHIRLRRRARTNDLNAMQAVVREFALFLVEQDPNPSAIVVSGQTLITFPNEKYSSKAAYIAYHRNNTVWGDDPILYTALHALGYQPVMHLVDTELSPYVPFEQTATRKPLRIDILNYGATRGGYHWELKGKTNPGAGNCMYYTVAQQIQRDLPKIQINPATQAEIELFEVKKTPKTKDTSERKEIAAVESTVVKHSIPESQDSGAKSQIESKRGLSSIAANDVSQEIIAASIKQAQVHADAFEAMKQQLTEFSSSQLSTEQLLTYYRELRDTVEDTYLEGRLKEISKERGDESIEAVVNGLLPIDAVDQNALRAELIHALARESSLRDSSYNYLSAQLDPILKIKAKPSDVSPTLSPDLPPERKLEIAKQVYGFFSAYRGVTGTPTCNSEARAEVDALIPQVVVPSIAS